MLCIAVLFLLAAVPLAEGAGQTTATLQIRGRPQVLRLYGTPGQPAVVVSSGDGGWIRLAPHVAEFLASRGFFVVGFDVRSYLAAFTTSSGGLDRQLEPADYAAVVEFAGRHSTVKPLLVGVSEGAGLSVLAAADAQMHSLIGGVVVLGLPDTNELGWRWRDSVIYITHGIPKEPLFSAAAVIGGVTPLPVAAIHSTHDEFAPVSEIERVMAAAGAPKRLWVVPASDHSFADAHPLLDRTLVEALDWIAAPSAH